MSKAFISLSSIPPRFESLGPTLESLLMQDAGVDAVQLWIPRSYRRFPAWDGRLPVVPEGVSIMRCDADLGPATKILPAVSLLAGENANILFCDDDRVYERDWAASMLRTAARKPDCCIAAMGRDIPLHLGAPRRSSDRLPRLKLGAVTSTTSVRERASGFVDLLEGYCGVLVKPEFFTPVAQDIPKVLWAVDDIWLSGQLERNGIRIWVESSIPLPTERLDVMALAPLQQAVIERHRRSQADRACIRYYRKKEGIWRLPPSSYLSTAVHFTIWGAGAAGRRLSRMIRHKFRQSRM